MTTPNIPIPSSLLLVFASLVFDAAPKLEPPGRRRLEGLALLLAPPANELANLPRIEGPRLLACICSSSSGGGEPDEGVEGDGEPGSIGEFMVV